MIGEWKMNEWVKNVVVVGEAGPTSPGGCGGVCGEAEAVLEVDGSQGSRVLGRVVRGWEAGEAGWLEGMGLLCEQRPQFVESSAGTRYKNR